MKEFVKTINEKIQRILTDADREKAAASCDLDAAKNRAEEAGEAKREAARLRDSKAFHKAKANESAALDEVEMHRNRLAYASGKRLVTAEENERTMNAIREKQKQLEDEYTGKVINLIQEIEKLGKEYYDQADELQELANNWHKSVYRQPHRCIEGRYAEIYDIRYDDGSLRHCIFDVVTGYFYRTKRGKGSYTGSGSIWT